MVVRLNSEPVLRNLTSSSEFVAREDQYTVKDTVKELVERFDDEDWWASLRTSSWEENVLQLGCVVGGFDNAPDEEWLISCVSVFEYKLLSRIEIGS